MGNRTEKMTLANCPVTATIDAIGGKWKPLILYFLKERPHRFGELTRRIDGATKKVLTDHLRELELAEIVERTVYERTPPRRVEYSLSAYGETLRPVLNLMCDWGLAHRARETRRAGAAARLAREATPAPRGAAAHARG